MFLPENFINMRSVTITSETETEITRYGKNTEVGKRGNPHQWRIMFSTRHLDEDACFEFNAFVNALDGQYGTFSMACPYRWRNADKTAQVEFPLSAGQSLVQLKGLTNNQTVAIKSGSFIGFANHDKAYQVRFNAASDSNGKATVSIYPNLFSDVQANETVQEAVFLLRSVKDKNALLLQAKEATAPLVFTGVEAL